MNEPRVTLRLAGGKREYAPGESLAGEFRLDVINRSDIRALELSVLWYTEGKGDEDLEVHYFLRQSADEGDYINPHRPGRFSTHLPASPLSYDGVIVKIRWCVRLRLFLPRGREIVEEQAFRVGSLPPARAVLP
ncbi:MAG: hypothetical protein K1X74_11475 [Pirellulales bacterium]|nr:hypothetical protein [Pirellulales bacterium]